MLYPEEKGSSTEISILKYIEKTGLEYRDYREKYEPVQKFPFSSARKRMSVIIERKQDNCLFVKGASEMVLDSCNKWFDPETNKIEVMSATAKEKIEEIIHKMAESSLRTLCMAYKPINSLDNLEKKDSKGLFDI